MTPPSNTPDATPSLTHTSDLTPVTSVYVSGPMTGYKDFNYPAFLQAERALFKASQPRVVSPAKESRVENETTWNECVKRGLIDMLSCDGVVVLDGWEGSRGARLEVHVALEVGMQVCTLEDYMGVLSGEAKTHDRKGAEEETQTVSVEEPSTPTKSLSTGGVADLMGAEIGRLRLSQSIFDVSSAFMEKHSIGNRDTHRWILAAEIEQEVIKKARSRSYQNEEDAAQAGVFKILSAEFGKQVTCTGLEEEPQGNPVVREEVKDSDEIDEPPY